MTSTVEMVNVQPSIPDYYESRPVLYIAGAFRNEIIVGKDTLTGGDFENCVCRVDTAGTILSGFKLNKYRYPSDIEAGASEQIINENVFVALDDQTICRFNNLGHHHRDASCYYSINGLCLNEQTNRLITTGYLCGKKLWFLVLIGGGYRSAREIPFTI